MYPILLPFPRITTYGAMLLLAWGLGWWVARRRARQVGIASWHIDWLIPLLLVSTALGTRVAGWLCQTFSGGGANDHVLFGGLLAAVAAAMAYGRLARIPLGRLGDAFAISLPLGIGVLRVGCFLAGCCWGDICDCRERLAAVDDQAWLRQVQTIPALCRGNWPICVTFPAGSPAYYQHLAAGLLTPAADRSLPVHPVQLYEATATFSLAGLLLLVDRRLRRWGDSFLLSVLGYSVLRFVVEWVRADNSVLAYGWTFSQWAGILSATACVLLGSIRARLTRHVLPINRT